jgi:hypothetical protein
MKRIVEAPSKRWLGSDELGRRYRLQNNTTVGRSFVSIFEDEDKLPGALPK